MRQLLAFIGTWLLVSSAFALGGATSGGGEDEGIQIRRALRFVSTMVAEDSSGLYSPEMKKLFARRTAKLKIAVIEEALPATIGSSTQNGTAFTSYDGNTAVMKIQRARWKAIVNPVEQEKLIHHELAVLIGAETTGDYHLTDQFAAIRSQLWAKIRAQGFVCTFSLFTQKNHGGKKVIGRHLGSGAVIINLDARSDFSIIADLEDFHEGQSNRAVIIRYVSTDEGYLRGQISEADVQRYKETDDDFTGRAFKVFSGLKNTSEEKIYFSPYDFVEARESQLQTWNGYLIQTGCSKQ